MFLTLLTAVFTATTSGVHIRSAMRVNENERQKCLLLRVSALKKSPGESSPPPPRCIPVWPRLTRSLP
eukprot:3863438-Rhodomonas_salina.1